MVVSNGPPPPFIRREEEARGEVTMFGALFGKKTPKSPNPGWAETVSHAYRHTPDLYLIEDQARHLVFIYGEMMANRYFSCFLADHGEKRTEGFTVDKSFSLWSKRNGDLSYPIALRGVEDFRAINNNTNTARIKGEVWSITPQGMFALDNEFQNGVLFERARVRLTVPFQVSCFDNTGKRHYGTTDKRHSLVRAWMYTGNKEHWEDQLDGGFEFSPAPRFKSKQNGFGDYYYWTPNEFERLKAA